jgi:hypothetical protein
MGGQKDLSWAAVGRSGASRWPIVAVALAMALTGAASAQDLGSLSEATDLPVGAGKDVVAYDAHTITSSMRNNFSASAMWGHRLDSDWSAVNTLRYDYLTMSRVTPTLAGDILANLDYDRFMQSVSDYSALIDRIGKDDSLRFAASRGLQLPVLDRLGDIQHAFARPLAGTLLGNTDLYPGVVYDQQIAWDHRLGSGDTNFRLTLFHDMTMNHGGSQLLSPTLLPAAAQAMAAGSHANGIELGLRGGTASGWSGSFDYTRQYVHQPAELTLDNALPSDQVKAALGYGWGDWHAEITGSLVNGIRGRIGDPLLADANQDPALKSYGTLSPSVNWHDGDRITVTLSGDLLRPVQDSRAQTTGTTAWLSLLVRY